MRLKLPGIYVVKISSISLLMMVWSLTVCALENAPPKNILLFIGDGMGITQISAAKIIKGTLNLDQFKVMGLLTTHSADDLITDSAAAGTALATGYKTNNGMIAQQPDGTRLKTIIEYAIQKNKATGMVVSSSITHATPAAFLTHTTSRDNHYDIAEQMAQSNVDVLLGGGWGYFVPQTVSGSLRRDDKDLLKIISLHKTVIQTEQDFFNLPAVDSVVGLFAEKHLKKAELRQPSLTQMTDKAIKILSESTKGENNGFFLMVEGSQIDWAGHQNNKEYLMGEMIDFDKAIGIGLEYARKDQQTLLIVTSDHETGGFAIHSGSVKYKDVSSTSFASHSHTAAMVPVFAYGPGSALFTGIHDNTSIGQNVIQYIEPSN